MAQNFTRGQLEEIKAGVIPAGVHKVQIFSDAAGAGALNSTIKLFNVKGSILCSLRGYVETSLTGASATLVHGVAGTTNMLIPILTCTTLTVNKGIDKSAAVVARGTSLDKGCLWFVKDDDIIATDATAAITAGKIHYILDFIDISADGNSAVTAY